MFSIGATYNNRENYTVGAISFSVYNLGYINRLLLYYDKTITYKHII